MLCFLSVFFLWTNSYTRLESLRALVSFQNVNSAPWLAFGHLFRHKPVNIEYRKRGFEIARNIVLISSRGRIHRCAVPIYRKLPIFGNLQKTLGNNLPPRISIFKSYLKPSEYQTRRASSLAASLLCNMVPLEHVHEIRQVIWMRCVVKLQDIQGIVLELQHRCLVVVRITIIRGTEDGDDSRETRPLIHTVHLIPFELRFVSADN